MTRSLKSRNNEFLVKKFLRDNRDILFTRADKGSITVAIDRNDYIEKMERALGDTNTYSRNNYNPVKKIERSLNSLLKNWRQKDYISDHEYHRLRWESSQGIRTSQNSQSQLSP